MSAVLDLLGSHAVEATRQSFGTAAKLREQLLVLGEDRGIVLRHSECSWASITYSGTRHSIELEFTGHAAVLAGEAMLAKVTEHDFTIPGLIVADAAVRSVEQISQPVRRLVCTVELLLLEEN